MEGWVIYNGHMASHAFLQFPKAIQQAAAQYDISIELVANDAVVNSVDANGHDIHALNGLSKPSFVIFHDKDIALARQLEYAGIPVYNNANCIEICDNKVIMYQKLAEHHVTIPKTLIAPKVFTGAKLLHFEHYLQIASSLNYPFVVKEGFGSFGEQVYLVHHEKEYRDIVKKIYDKPFVMQEYIESSYGKDIRVFIVGGRFVAALKRTSQEDFRANVYQGSRIEAYSPSEEEIQLAINAVHAVGADFAGVDLLFGKGDRPIVCEVNTNAHVANILTYTGINVAEKILQKVILPAL
ncbi:ATP-grasp domain-containing protein [Gracilibacillus dipsosauri]|uniref:ATP-grasp domain-containing protein n=1 Tax=Gracilibacillus dipsosauri TaxID=178340 RepID=UPI0024099DA1